MNYKILLAIFLVSFFMISPASCYVINDGTQTDADEVVNVIVQYHEYSIAKDVDSYVDLFVYPDPDYLEIKKKSVSEIWNAYTPLDYDLWIREVTFSGEKDVAIINFITQVNIEGEISNGDLDTRTIKNEYMASLFLIDDEWKILDVNDVAAFIEGMNAIYDATDDFQLFVEEENARIEQEIEQQWREDFRIVYESMTPEKQDEIKATNPELVERAYNNELISTPSGDTSTEDINDEEGSGFFSKLIFLLIIIFVYKKYKKSKSKN